MSLPESLEIKLSSPIGKFNYRKSVVIPFPPLPMLHKRNHDKAIVTWVAGDEAYKWFSITGSAMKFYANRVGADFVVIEGYSGQPYLLSNKFRLKQVFEQYNYKRVVFVDADALILPHCPNLFELVPSNYFGILEETQFFDEWTLAQYRREASELALSQGYRVDYLTIPPPRNSGLMLISAEHKEVLTPPQKPFPLCFRNGATVEQTWLSLQLAWQKIPIYSLKYPEHHWVWYADPEEKDVEKAGVLHFAGCWEKDKRFERLAHYGSKCEVRSNYALGGLNQTKVMNMPDLERQMMIDHPAVPVLKMPIIYDIDTHRYGWKVVTNTLSYLTNPNGILLDSFVEYTFLSEVEKSRKAKRIPYCEPWIGFMHHPPDVPDWSSINKYRIQNLSQTPEWLDSLQYCLGLYSMSEYLASWARKEWGVPCEVVRYPTLVPDYLFSIEQYEAEPVKTIACIGFWLRRFSSFSMLKADGFRKIRPMVMTNKNAVGMNKILAYEEEEAQSRQFNSNGIQPVETVPRLSGLAYDKFLSKTIVFLDLIDASAVTTIVECMVRGTPLLINRIPAVMEYLGKDYPLYIETLEEAATKLRDAEIIRAAHYHIKSNPMVQKLTPQEFLNMFAETQIYQNAVNIFQNREI